MLAPGGCGTRRRTCAALDGRRAAARLAGAASRATACARRRGVARPARVAVRSGACTRPSWPAGCAARVDLSRCRRATSRSGLSVSRPRWPAARWCSATSRACARSGATPRSSCRPDDHERARAAPCDADRATRRRAHGARGARASARARLRAGAHGARLPATRYERSSAARAPIGVRRRAACAS